jgi:hypothetical protein
MALAGKRAHLSGRPTELASRTESLAEAATVKPRRINAWGLASVVAVSLGFLDDLTCPGSPNRFAIASLASCAILQLAAIMCGMIAALRGSGWWLAIVLLSGLMALADAGVGWSARRETVSASWTRCRRASASPGGRKACRDLDEHYGPVQWVTEMTPILVKILVVMAAIIYVESALLNLF